MYWWVNKYLLEKILKLQDYRIILVGDSAGANLVLGIQNWIIVNKAKGVDLKMPQCVILDYPGKLSSSEHNGKSLYAVSASLTHRLPAEPAAAVDGFKILPRGR